jgi:hypothetical protein
MAGLPADRQLQFVIDQPASSQSLPQSAFPVPTTADQIIADFVNGLVEEHLNNPR